MKGVSVLISDWYSGLDPFGRAFVICLAIWVILRVAAAAYDRWIARKPDD